MDNKCDVVNSGFNVVGAAGSHSELTAVIAGVIFTGIILILGSSLSARSEDRQNALTLLFVAFFAMLVTSFQFAAVSGEEVCRRASAEVVPAGALFGVGAVSTFLALGWLFRAYESSNATLLTVSTAVFFAVLLFAFLQLAITVYDTQLQYGPQLGVAALMWTFVACGLSVITFHAYCWYRRVQYFHPPIWWNTAAVIGFALLAVTLFNIVSITGPTSWQPDAPPLALPVAAIGALTGMLPVVFIMGASAPPRPGIGRNAIGSGRPETRDILPSPDADLASRRNEMDQPNDT